jgi:chaperone BCS1
MEVEFELVDRDLATQMYHFVFELPDEVDLTREKWSKDQLVLERLADEFAVKVPEHEFSPAEILSFLVPYRDSPNCALDNVEEWVARTLQEKRRKRAGACDDALSRKDSMPTHRGYFHWIWNFWNA